jgi:hypothetical protein
MQVSWNVNVYRNYLHSLEVGESWFIERPQFFYLQSIAPWSKTAQFSNVKETGGKQTAKIFEFYGKLEPSVVLGNQGYPENFMDAVNKN